MISQLTAAFENALFNADVRLVAATSGSEVNR
jgi:hypothetical protein